MKRWYIQEGIYFEKLSGNIFSLNYDADESCIPLIREEIDDIIDALQRIKAHYETDELKEMELEKLANWHRLVESIESVRE